MITTTRILFRDPPFRVHAGRHGITLLEVLVACGILAVGLASVAALLPAAGARLGQASIEDRVGNAAANAYADIVNRGLLSSNVFTLGPAGSGTRALVFGAVLRSATMPAAASSIVVSDTNSWVAARMDVSRATVLEDDVVYNSGTSASGILNSFLNSNLGPREYREGVCWGATLTSTASPIVPGSPATLGIAVFRKATQPVITGTPIAPYGVAITLTGTTTGVPPFRLVSSPASAIAADAIRKQFLPPCSAVLLLPRAGAPASARPTWLPIPSSWTTGSSGIPVNSFITFDHTAIPDYTANYVTVTGGSSSISALMFDGLMRVDQYPVTLD